MNFVINNLLNKEPYCMMKNEAADPLLLVTNVFKYVQRAVDIDQCLKRDKIFSQL